MNRNHAFRRISHYIGNDTSCGYSRLPSCRRMSGSAEFLPRPNIRRKHCGRRKRRRIYKFRSAAAKNSANLQLSLPFLLSVKLYSSLADFQRGIWVCLRNGGTEYVSDTRRTGSAIHFVYCFTAC